MTHRIKLYREFCDAVASGDKNFEIRKNDRGYRRGDKVRFVSVEKVFNRGREETVDIHHPVDNKEYEITYVLSGWYIKDGYVAFGIRETKKQEEWQR